MQYQGNIPLRFSKHSDEFLENLKELFAVSREWIMNMLTVCNCPQKVNDAIHDILITISLQETCLQNIML